MKSQNKEAGIAPRLFAVLPLVQEEHDDDDQPDRHAQQPESKSSKHVISFL
jgi:hypothetical protein